MKCVRLFEIFLFSTISVSLLKGQCDLENFRKHSIVPNIINKTPKTPLKVEFHGQSFACGNILNRDWVQSPPSVNYALNTTNEWREIYLLLMIDPDAYTPQNPSVSPIRHWLIQNIPGNQINKGEVVTPYVRPQPPSYSDPHRYIILIYQQPGFMGPSHLSDNDRKNFDVKVFERSKQLKGPIAGSFFYVGIQ